ncbi:MAG: GNAT family N-acetyltransferase [Hyphomicrobiales bacterium]
MPVEIRKLDTSDLMEFKRLRLEALKTNPESFGSNYAREAKYDDAKFLTLMQADETRYILGAFDGEILVSTMGIFNEPQNEAEIASIWGVFTSPSHRGQKIAKQLIKNIIKNAAANPALSKINLGVTSKSEAAQKLYKSVGFMTYAVEENAIIHDDLSMCEILMSFDLK